MIRTLVIDDVAISRELTVAALQHEDQIKIIGQASTLNDGLRWVGHCDVVLFRAEIPDDTSLQTVQSLIDMNPSCKIIVVGLKKSEAAALAFIEAGAMGYVYEGDSFVELVRSITAAAEDKARVSGRMAVCLMTRIQELKQLSAQLDHVYQYRHRFEQLTPREREVLELIGEGLSNRKIAKRLYVEAGTVKNHVHNILKKLQVRNRHDAAAFLALNQSTAQPALAAD